MALKYALASTTFAFLCSLCWLMMGGSAWSALGMYLVSGQVAMMALVLKAALRAQPAPLQRR